ncbi:hypothetical protein M1394_00215 [Candidatus Marsarchaeota archaeon]|nr:hypothetical protein [Candidatus Marsarchaeota archaeon]
MYLLLAAAGIYVIIDGILSIASRKNYHSRLYEAGRIVRVIAGIIVIAYAL